jgi:mono/diheme cytochrome c family protein
MAGERRSRLGAFVFGAVTMLVVAAAIGAAMALGGFYPVAASSPHSAPVRWLLTESREHSVRRSASGLKPPQFTPADIQEGAGHFKGMCQDCHGGPGAEPEEFAAGMNPRPPNLAEAAGDLSVSEVFWIEKHGLKMTGMPSFAKTDPDDDLWKVAAFVKAMSKMKAADYAAVPNAHEDEHEHHHDMTGDKGHDSD